MGVIPNSHAQNVFKVTYSVTDVKIQGSLDNLDNNSKQLFEKMADYTKDVNYILIANQEESYFEQENALNKESDSPLEHILSRGAQRFTSFNERVYANHNVDSIVFVRNILNQDFTVKRDYFNFNWVFKKETKKILDFNAIKAEGSYYHPVTNEDLKVVAWYIPSIQLQSGPDIFMGLPGLIAEVDLKGAIVTIKKIETIKNLEIEKINDLKAMNQQEFKDLIKSLNKKFENYIDD
ncbi:MAG: GLPGLI family protein [Flavobacteriales bacterium]|nr:GLPGLI family protein [Flavobacteriia bacterium]NCP07155.1 GLPGLI family protein [Flavobacteriales bacterium]NCP50708.1 GLPGLI family protein [Flavobacteriales bacterium]NCP58847.1 GLPGLI family protein [Flavobacteriales bacterium]NCP88763.1 GLPGLI family protein [Flavobacteriales bacterium]